MSNNIYIQGLGIISAIGNNVQECLDALQNRADGIAEMRYMQSAHKHELPVAEVKKSNRQLAEMAGMPASLTRTALLSAIAAKEALADTAIENIADWKVGFISANTVGGMDKTEDFYKEFLQDTSKGKLRDIANHECGSATEIVAEQLGATDYITTISTACSSSANSIFYGARLIRNGILDIAIAGGADALTKFTLNGFNTLMILDKEPCKPFDENRKGLNLGEGAAYVVLVSERVMKTLSKQPYCKLSAYCNANDAYHQTASSPDGTGSYLAMKGALERSGLRLADIDYINLHGTGTQNNDSAEGTAIKRLFDPHYPKLSSTKAYTGHTLGASGGVEAVFASLAIKHGLIYPNLRFETQIADQPFAPETQLIRQDVKNVLSNSFGFGGNCSSLIFSKV
ncbi:beta-ketoacyl-[acyl-carrier-protein] synthase family protein [Pinibacter soli]|uniref:Beta-ketoacyl-[acyl-carrier-protein] synthase family protein n=1 Tax=Pinibacter soli TaxID=3044211 RepID=A0ABT6RC03_9BACT|nr:beta-ketoacyl-[acyl-carrier-protein] synthase family protein [Pinibacter soli]MDI3320094.1 beta-ketoacyl-[acyl-carrier-protein] synthase family protein [Pinibacter soli]